MTVRRLWNPLKPVNGSGLMYIWLEAWVIPQASRLAEEDKQKKTHIHRFIHTGDDPQRHW